MLVLLASSEAVFGAQKYGFSSGVKACALWDTFFPISFKIPNDLLTVNYSQPMFNIIYVADGNIKHMDDFYDLYRVRSEDVWPTSPDLANGRSNAICQNNGDCVPLAVGGVGKGVSAYNDILGDEFVRNDTIKVMSNSPYSDGTISWLFLPTRKLKLLRIELFTPYKTSVNNFAVASEPLFFEYRATGNGDEMKLTEKGGTSVGGNINDVMLPSKLKLTTLSAIQIWLYRGGNSSEAYAGLLPAAQVISFTSGQMKLIPENCR